jgi:hypothetical protein
VDNEFDISQVSPHSCMTDMVQIGPYAHCNTANHDMFIGPLKQIVKTKHGFTIKDIIVR